MWQTATFRHGTRHPGRLGFFVAAWALAGALPAAPDARQVEFFEQRIRPVLAGECYACHGAEKQKGGLRLDHRDALRQGGDSGPALVPGKPAESLLLRVLRHEVDDLKMPKDGAKLDDATLRDFASWIAQGAPDPRDQPPAAASASTWADTLAVRRQWWSLQPVRRPPVPKPRDLTWSDHPVDRFLLAKMEEQGLSPAGPADPRALIRRLSFALTGLPPTSAEVEEFVMACETSNHPPLRIPHSAFSILVDRLLGSPRFGERWARHWMDIVRFAETHGSESDPEIREAWRYRDYLIRAFNADVPIDHLIREHIAGDLLPNPRINRAEGLNESLLGIASLRLNDHGFQPIDTLDDQVKTIENQIDVLSKAFQGLTVACARCHDHKFDAVSQRDFYALFGVLASVRPAQVIIDTPVRVQTNHAQLAALKPRIRDALADAWLEAAKQVPDHLLGRTPADAELAALRRQVQEIETQLSTIEHEARAAQRGAGVPPAQPVQNDVTDSQASQTGATPVPRPPFARWGFEQDARDSVGELHGSLLEGATLANGRLILDGKAAHVRTAPLRGNLRERTIEAWVALATLDQGGGGVMTIETANGAVFDAIVFAEREPRRWVNGSDHFRRSRNLDGAEETAGPGELVHLVVVYGADNSVTFYRNGQPYAPTFLPAGEHAAVRTYEAGDGRLLFGRRHTGGGRAFLRGELEEARLYDRALTGGEVAASFHHGHDAWDLAQLLARLSPAKREQHGALRVKLASLRRELTAKESSQSPWPAALGRAAKDPLHPLHPWTVLSKSQAGAFASDWAGVAERTRKLLEPVETDYREFWDLTEGGGTNWFRHSAHLPDRAAPAGEFAVLPGGDRVLAGLLPAGVYSHAWSERHDGLFTSPRFKIETDSISVRAAGRDAMVRLIVDNYPLGVNPIFPKAALDSDTPRWVRLDTAYRKGSWAYLELATDNRLTRPVYAKGRRGPEDGRSWFGVTHVVFHDSKEAPKEKSQAAAVLFDHGAPASVEQLSVRYRQALERAITSWREGKLVERQRAFLDLFLGEGLLPVSLGASPEVARLVAEYRRLEAQVPELRHAPGVVEAEPYDAPFLPRGDHLKPGDPVPRGYLGVLGMGEFFSRGNGTGDKASSFPLTPALSLGEREEQRRGRRNQAAQKVSQTGLSLSPLPRGEGQGEGNRTDQDQWSGRLELAHALTDPRNPLTARVMVNRIWQHLFGVGLVPSVDNFGRLGEKPTHPELLDFLAARFVEDGWSTKQMIRFLVTSRAWQMGSEPSQHALAADPANTWLSHFHVRRLEAEAIRDSLLAVSSRLDTTMGGPGDNALARPADQHRRSVYLTIRRNNLNPFLDAFDAPRPFTTLGRRDETNVPAQSLALLNDPFVIEQARRWAAALIASDGAADADTRIRSMFAAALSRPPSAQELTDARAYVSDLARIHGAEGGLLASEPVWRDLAQALFNLKEFIYVR
jgi:hypothetical protein